MAISAAGAALGAAGIGAVGSLLGGAQQSAASAKQAKINREFQERMSNTAYQRAADDLEAAGLNRILALGSPASTPGGAMGNVANYGELFGSAINTGVQAFSSAKQAQQTDSNINKQRAEANKILQETKGIETRNKILLSQSKIWDELAPIVIKGSKGLNDLISFLSQPGNQSDFVEMVARETPAVRTALKDFVINRYKSTPQAKAIIAIIEKAKSVSKHVVDSHNPTRRRK